MYNYSHKKNERNNWFPRKYFLFYEDDSVFESMIEYSYKSKKS